MLELVKRLAQALGEAGGRAVLVGGAVRDALLGLEAHDADIEVFGLSAEAVEALARRFGAVHLVGRQFAVLHLATEHGTVELSLPRLESKTGPGHRGFAVSADPHMEPATAALRRDFTVNAMMLDLRSGEVLDPWGGRADLQRGLLRHVSPAFAEDPLRVLRAARFVARFGWRVDAATARLCRSLDLAELPRERLEGEWRQILLRGDHPGRGLLVLEQLGALRHFPELAALRGVPQDPLWHPEGDVLHHTALALDAAVGLREQMEDPWVEMLAVLCHDLGKAFTTVFERGRWRSPAHDTGGEEPTRSLLARMSANRSMVEAVVALVRDHLRPSQLYAVRDHVGDGALRRLAARVPVAALARVAWADSAGRTQAVAAQWPPTQWLLQRCAELGVRDQAPTPLLFGRDLLARGWQPGPQVGEVLKQAFEAQLEGAFGDRAGGLAWLDRQRPAS